jgi:hypothetical protein
MTRDELLAEWGDVVYNAQENYTVDPHEHIERLIAAGDQLAALSTPAPVTPPVGEAERLREALVKVRMHTAYMPAAPYDLLTGLLASIERIADAALASPAPVEIHHGTAETVIGPGPHDGSAWAVPAPSYKE